MNKQTQENLLKLVKKNYEEIAEDFNQTRKNRSWPELIKLTEKIDSRNKILDAGCGNGRLLEILADRKVNYLGIDISQELLDIAKSRFPDFEFIYGDILSLDKISQIDFDYVFCIAVLHHLPGRDLQVDALKQLKNKVKKDGKIILTVWNLWSQGKFRKLIFKFFLLKLIGKNKMDLGDIIFEGFGKSSKRYYHAFTRFGIRRLSRKAGLKIEKLYKDKFNYYIILSR